MSKKDCKHNRLMEKVVNGDSRRYCTQCTSFVVITPEQIAAKKLIRKHIKGEVIERCWKSPTLYACVIRNSYEDEPVIVLGRKSHFVRNADSEFLFLMREFVNVKMQVTVETLIEVDTSRYYREATEELPEGYEIKDTKDAKYPIFKTHIEYGKRKIEI